MWGQSDGARVSVRGETATARRRPRVDDAKCCVAINAPWMLSLYCVSRASLSSFVHSLSFILTSLLSVSHTYTHPHSHTHSLSVDAVECVRVNDLPGVLAVLCRAASTRRARLSYVHCTFFRVAVRCILDAFSLHHSLTHSHSHLSFRPPLSQPCLSSTSLHRSSVATRSSRLSSRTRSGLLVRNLSPLPLLVLCEPGVSILGSLLARCTSSNLI
jgi:hypothetical protein